MSTRESTLAATPAPSPVAASSRFETLREPFLRAVIPVLLIALWQLASSTGVVSEFVLPAPVSVLSAYRELLQSGDLQDALKISLARAALGLLLGGGAGLLLGVAAGLSKSAERGFDTVLQMLRTIPFIALVPIFVVWFGIGELSKIALIVGAAISPMYLSTYHAIRGIDPKLLELGHTFRLTRGHQIRLIILPTALPGILVGVRYSAAISLLALVAAEQINASAGIGFILNNANQFQRTDIIIAGILVYAVLGIGVDAFLRLVERKALVWRGTHV
ncbi:ABC transporter permease [Paraburkholderia graminis]|uniref:ABC transporter permease n=1 Tax=Paraburkholderia graminis TaxID=60548 RepID=UPI00278D42F5|nr:ABC transporter permease [Paraburkholderia graminis]MDQ0625901.1 sulfonate transport system permease protein [Paraburkholderia graminis]